MNDDKGTLWVHMPNAQNRVDRNLDKIDQMASELNPFI